MNGATALFRTTLLTLAVSALVLGGCSSDAGTSANRASDDFVRRDEALAGLDGIRTIVTGPEQGVGVTPAWSLLAADQDGKPCVALVMGDQSTYCNPLAAGDTDSEGSGVARFGPNQGNWFVTGIHRTDSILDRAQATYLDGTTQDVSRFVVPISPHTYGFGFVAPDRREVVGLRIWDSNGAVVVDMNIFDTAHPPDL